MSDERSGEGPPPPSPLTGAYLLIVLPQLHSPNHKDRLIHALTKGLITWDAEDCHVDLDKELQNITAKSPEGEEAKNGERLIQFASENLVTEVLIHPQLNTLVQCIRNCLSSFTRHRHIVHAGYTSTGNGAWILQDGTYSFSDFADMYAEHEVQRVLRAYEGTVSVDVHCSSEGDWWGLKTKDPFSKVSRVRLNPPDKASASASVRDFLSYLSKYLVPAGLQDILEASDVVGNIRFSQPTLYVFPGGQGDAALFGINGFNMLVDGGFSRKSCFWDFTRHLDRLDSVLMTRINNGNLQGLASLFRRKKADQVYPQIGHFFSNIPDRKHVLSPDGDKDRDPLLVNIIEEGQEMLSGLRHLGLKPQACYREPHVDPINLYHKVGHGKLDMYVLSPAKDSREVREFLAKWAAVDSKIFCSYSRKGEFNFPLSSKTSICALLVWQPANPEDNITRILFPGSTPQQKIFEGLDRLKNLEFMKHPVCSAKSLSPSSSTVRLSIKSALQPPSKPTLIEKIAESEKKQAETVKAVKQVGEIKKSTIPPKSKPKVDRPKEKPKTDLETKLETGKIDKKPTEAVQKIDKEIKKEKPKKPAQKLPEKKTTKPTEKKDSVKSSPTTPKKTVDSNVAETAKPETKPPLPKSKASPSATPAKSAKEANNRKVVELKSKETTRIHAQKTQPAKREDPEKQKKIQDKPVTKKAGAPPQKEAKSLSPMKAAKPDTRKKLDVKKTGKSEKEITTDSSAVSTPSTVDAELTKTKEDTKSKEVVKPEDSEISRKESEDRGKSISKEEDEEILIIEKVEISNEATGKSDVETIELHLQKANGEKKKPLEAKEISPEKQQEGKEEADVLSESQQVAEEEVQEIIETATDIVTKKLDMQKTESQEISGKDIISTDKLITPKEIKSVEVEHKIDESQPDEKFSTTVESGATTTAPTLPEDERIPLDEIKEGVEEKYAKEETKEKEAVSTPRPEQPSSLPQVPVIAGTVFDQRAQLLKEIVKTPDEVADLPVHEEVDVGFYESDRKEELLSLPTAKKEKKEETTEEMKLFKDNLEKEDKSKDLKEDMVESVDVLSHTTTDLDMVSSSPKSGKPLESDEKEEDELKGHELQTKEPTDQEVTKTQQSVEKVLEGVVADEGEKKDMPEKQREKTESEAKDEILSKESLADAQSQDKEITLDKDGVIGKKEVEEKDEKIPEKDEKQDKQQSEGIVKEIISKEISEEIVESKVEKVEVESEKESKSHEEKEMLEPELATLVEPELATLDEDKQEEDKKSVEDTQKIHGIAQEGEKAKDIKDEGKMEHEKTSKIPSESAITSEPVTQPKLDKLEDISSVITDIKPSDKDEIKKDESREKGTAFSSKAISREPSPEQLESKISGEILKDVVSPKEKPLPVSAEKPSEDESKGTVRSKGAELEEKEQSQAYDQLVTGEGKTPIKDDLDKPTITEETVKPSKIDEKTEGPEDISKIKDSSFLKDQDGKEGKMDEDKYINGFVKEDLDENEEEERGIDVTKQYLGEIQVNEGKDIDTKGDKISEGETTLKDDISDERKSSLHEKEDTAEKKGSLTELIEKKASDELHEQKIDERDTKDQMKLEKEEVLKIELQETVEDISLSDHLKVEQKAKEVDEDKKVVDVAAKVEAVVESSELVCEKPKETEELVQLEKKEISGMEHTDSVTEKIEISKGKQDEVQTEKLTEISGEKEEVEKRPESISVNGIDKTDNTVGLEKGRDKTGEDKLDEDLEKITSIKELSSITHELGGLESEDDSKSPESLVEQKVVKEHDKTEIPTIISTPEPETKDVKGMLKEEQTVSKEPTKVEITHTISAEKVKAVDQEEKEIDKIDVEFKKEIDVHSQEEIIKEKPVDESNEKDSGIFLEKDMEAKDITKEPMTEKISADAVLTVQNVLTDIPLPSGVDSQKIKLKDESDVEKKEKEEISDFEKEMKEVQRQFEKLDKETGLRTSSIEGKVEPSVIRDVEGKTKIDQKDVFHEQKIMKEEEKEDVIKDKEAEIEPTQAHEILSDESDKVVDADRAKIETVSSKTTDSSDKVPDDIKEEVSDKKDDLREKISEKIYAKDDSIDKKYDSIKEEISDKKDDAKEEILDKKHDVKEEILDKKYDGKGEILDKKDHEKAEKLPGEVAQDRSKDDSEIKSKSKEKLSPSKGDIAKTQEVTESSLESVDKKETSQKHETIPESKPVAPVGSELNGEKEAKVFVDEATDEKGKEKISEQKDGDDEKEIETAPILRKGKEIAEYNILDDSDIEGSDQGLQTTEPLDQTSEIHKEGEPTVAEKNQIYEMPDTAGQLRQVESEPATVEGITEVIEPLKDQDGKVLGNEAIEEKKIIEQIIHEDSEIAEEKDKKEESKVDGKAKAIEVDLIVKEKDEDVAGIEKKVKKDIVSTVKEEKGSVEEAVKEEKKDEGDSDKGGIDKLIVETKEIGDIPMDKKIDMDVSIKDSSDSTIKEEKEDKDVSVKDEKISVDATIKEEKKDKDVSVKDEKISVDATIKEEKKDKDVSVKDEKISVDATIKEAKKDKDVSVKDEKMSVDATIKEEKKDKDVSVKDEKISVDATIKEEKIDKDVSIKDEKMSVDATIKEVKKDKDVSVKDEKISVDATIKEEKKDKDVSVKDEKISADATIKEEKKGADISMDEKKDVHATLKEEKKDEGEKEVAAITTKGDSDTIVKDEKEGIVKEEKKADGSTVLKEKKDIQFTTEDEIKDAGTPIKDEKIQKKDVDGGLEEEAHVVFPPTCEGKTVDDSSKGETGKEVSKDTDVSIKEQKKETDTTISKDFIEPIEEEKKEKDVAQPEAEQTLAEVESTEVKEAPTKPDTEKKTGEIDVESVAKEPEKGKANGESRDAKVETDTVIPPVGTDKGSGIEEKESKEDKVSDAKKEGISGAIKDIDQEEKMVDVIKERELKDKEIKDEIKKDEIVKDSSKLLEEKISEIKVAISDPQMSSEKSSTEDVIASKPKEEKGPTDVTNAFKIDEDVKEEKKDKEKPLEEIKELTAEDKKDTKDVKDVAPEKESKIIEKDDKNIIDESLGTTTAEAKSSGKVDEKIELFTTKPTEDLHVDTRIEEIKVSEEIKSDKSAIKADMITEKEMVAEKTVHEVEVHTSEAQIETKVVELKEGSGSAIYKEEFEKSDKQKDDGEKPSAHEKDGTDVNGKGKDKEESLIAKDEDPLKSSQEMGSRSEKIISDDIGLSSQKIVTSRVEQTAEKIKQEATEKTESVQEQHESHLVEKSVAVSVSKSEDVDKKQEKQVPVTPKAEKGSIDSSIKEDKTDKSESTKNIVLDKEDSKASDQGETKTEATIIAAGALGEAEPLGSTQSSINGFTEKKPDETLFQSKESESQSFDSQKATILSTMESTITQEGDISSAKGEKDNANSDLKSKMKDDKQSSLVEESKFSETSKDHEASSQEMSTRQKVLEIKGEVQELSSSIEKTLSDVKDEVKEITSSIEKGILGVKDQVKEVLHTNGKKEEVQDSFSKVSVMESSSHQMTNGKIEKEGVLVSKDVTVPLEPMDSLGKHETVSDSKTTTITKDTLSDVKTYDSKTNGFQKDEGVKKTETTFYAKSSSPELKEEAFIEGASTVESKLGVSSINGSASQDKSKKSEKGEQVIGDLNSSETIKTEISNLGTELEKQIDIIEQQGSLITKASSVKETIESSSSSPKLSERRTDSPSQGPLLSDLSMVKDMTASFISTEKWSGKSEETPEGRMSPSSEASAVLRESDDDLPASPLSTTSHLHSPPPAMFSSVYGQRFEDDDSDVEFETAVREQAEVHKQPSVSKQPIQLPPVGTKEPPFEMPLTPRPPLPGQPSDTKQSHFTSQSSEQKFHLPSQSFASQPLDPTKPPLGPVDPSSQTDVKKAVPKDPIEKWDKPLGLPPPPSGKDYWSPFKEWGRPLHLPSPAPAPAENETDDTSGSAKTTPKKVAKMNEENNRYASNIIIGKEANNKNKRSESPVKKNIRDGKKIGMSHIYVDLSYVPHHGNSHYANVEFFKRVRARYYVFSGTEPSKEVFNALLEAKQTWEDKDLEVTIIPTYDTDTLGYWIAENEETLSKYKIDLSPSASRCTINLQDHDTSCSAYRLEF